ncbi:MAG: tyrosine-type recombinase/integrase [bacterium]
MKDTLTILESPHARSVRIQLKSFLASKMPATQRDYAYSLKSFFNWVGKNVRDVTFEDVTAYRNCLINTAGYRGNTIQKKLSAIRKFYTYLKDLGVIANNPTRGIDRVRFKQREKDILTVPEANRLLSAIDLSAADETSALLGKRDYAMAKLMLMNALRVCEVIRADVGDLRLHRGVHVLWVRGNGHMEKDDYVVLREDTLKAVNEYLMAREEWLGREMMPDEPLFAGVGNRHRNGRLSGCGVWRRIVGYIREAGIEKANLTPHSFRHSSITWAVEAGAPPERAKEHARHRSIQTTYDVYYHSSKVESNVNELMPRLV